MGAWSHEPFGNDQACDWAAELAESTGFAIIEKAFDQVTADQHEEFIDADTVCEAYAAAEVLAHILGQGTENLDFLGNIGGWIEKLPAQPAAALIKKALNALNILTQEHSELNELWQESGNYAEWTQNIDALKGILKSRL
mgnify:FL=1